MLVKISIQPFVYAFVLLTLLYSNIAFGFDYLQPLPEKPLVPKDNPMSKASILLGKKLFYDNNLSGKKSLSCNSCHNLLFAGSDGKRFSTGSNGIISKRSTPALWNIGLQTVLYWDGRSKSLEQQGVDHLTDPAVMAMTNELLQKRIGQDRKYRSLFHNAFKTKTINLHNVAKALASFQRSLMAPDSPFDRYIRGDKSALSELAIRGMKTFNEVGCLACHFGVNFAGPAPGPAMNLGDGFYELFPTARGSKYETEYDLLSDRGRYEATGKKDEIYMWRVPPLRNIALSPPYFHNGSAKTLREAVKVMGKAQFNFNLTDPQIDEITAFLRSLTGQRPDILNKAN